MIKVYLIMVLLYAIPLVFVSCKTTIKRTWLDRVIFIGGWIFVPFFPILFILTVFSRLERTNTPFVLKHKLLLMGKTWEEIRRRNFYLATEIFSFFISLYLFFSSITYFRDAISEKYFLLVILSGIILIFTPSVILHKVFTEYEKKIGKNVKN